MRRCQEKQIVFSGTYILHHKLACANSKDVLCMVCGQPCLVLQGSPRCKMTKILCNIPSTRQLHMKWNLPIKRRTNQAICLSGAILTLPPFTALFAQRDHFKIFANGAYKKYICWLQKHLINTGVSCTISMHNNTFGFIKFFDRSLRKLIMVGITGSSWFIDWTNYIFFGQQQSAYHSNRAMLPLASTFCLFFELLDSLIKNTVHVLTALPFLPNQKQLAMSILNMIIKHCSEFTDIFNKYRTYWKHSYFLCDPFGDHSRSTWYSNRMFLSSGLLHIYPSDTAYENVQPSYWKNRRYFHVPFSGDRRQCHSS